MGLNTTSPSSRAGGTQCSALHSSPLASASLLLPPPVRARFGGASCAEPAARFGPVGSRSGGGGMVEEAAAAEVEAEVEVEAAAAAGVVHVGDAPNALARKGLVAAASDGVLRGDAPPAIDRLRPPPGGPPPPAFDSWWPTHPPPPPQPHLAQYTRSVMPFRPRRVLRE
jgi:hypothetical protein